MSKRDPGVKIYPIEDLKNLHRRETHKKPCHKSLNGLEWSNQYITILIIPCLYSRDQAKAAQKQTFEVFHNVTSGNRMDIENFNIKSPSDYPDIILKLVEIINANPDIISSYFYPQNITPGRDEVEIVEHREYCFELFKGSETFSPEKAYRIKYAETDGMVDLLDQKELFLNLCLKNPFKINALFFDPVHTAWLSEFLHEHAKGELKILPGVKLLLVKIK